MAGYGGLALVLVLPGMEAAALAKAPTTSWAKAGVSLEQYRADALECGSRGLATDVSQSKPVAVLRKASEQLDLAENSLQAASNSAPPTQGSAPSMDLAMRAQSIETVRRSARPAQQVKQIKEIMFVTVRQCMVEHGYTRIALTEQQRAGYEKVPGNSAERLKYLHALASDPAVVESQRISPTS